MIHDVSKTDKVLALALQAHNIKACQLDLTLYPEEPVGREISDTGLSKRVLPCDLGGARKDFVLRLMTNLLEVSFEINKKLEYAELLIQIPHGQELLCIKFTRNRVVYIYFLEPDKPRDYVPGEAHRLEGYWDEASRQALDLGLLDDRDSENREGVRGLSEWVSDLRALKRPWSGAFFLKTQGNERLKGRCEIVFSKVRSHNLPALGREACQLDLTLYPEEPVGPPLRARPRRRAPPPATRAASRGLRPAGSARRPFPARPPPTAALPAREIKGTGLSKPGLPCDLGGDKRDFLLRLMTNLLEASFEINKKLEYAELLIQIPHDNYQLCIKFWLRNVTLYFLPDDDQDHPMPGYYGLAEGYWDDKTRQAQFMGFLANRDSVYREYDVAGVIGRSEWVSDLRALKRPWSGTFILKTQGNERLKGRCEIVFSKVRNLPALGRGFMSATSSYADHPSKRQRVG